MLPVPKGRQGRLVRPVPTPQFRVQLVPQVQKGRLVHKASRDFKVKPVQLVPLVLRAQQATQDRKVHKVNRV